MNLDDLVTAAQRETPEWDSARERRVLSATLVERSRRGARGRVVRRSVVAFSSVAVVVLMVFRGAASPNVGSLDSESSISDEAIAARDSDGDGGYRHD